MRSLADVIKRVFGIAQLRPLQREAMEAMLERRDSLLVLPTGGGKSLTYQAPAILLQGVTIVVSPLISLMQDQVRGLRELGVRAAMLASGQSQDERRSILRSLHQGSYDLLYVAPERLLLENFLERLKEVPLASLVIDEAHCISHWGHDFRPEYRELQTFREHFPELSIHACTATATERVREDIVQRLGLRDPLLLVGSFDRPNLCYRFRPRVDRKKQISEILASRRGQASIVYAMRRSDVDSLAAELVKEGHRVRPYHAGLDDHDRKVNQDEFLDERVDVIVATVAFGMGIDRPDVRLVLHAGLPKSLEHYLQESGRAGRDGEPADCTLLYSGADFHGWKGLIERAETTTDTDAAIARLSEMYSIATGARCRHRALAAHFGEILEPKNCQACDVCLKELPEMPEATDVARKILSCVYRLEQRFGILHVIDVLRGARNEKILGRGHDQISTFGLLSSWDAGSLKGAIDQLIGQGLLSLHGDPYPILTLRPESRAVLRGEEEVQLFLPPKPARRLPKVTATGSDERVEDLELQSPADRAVFDDLRAMRRQLAEQRGVRPYMIFSDATLRALSRERPRTREELLNVRGIGERKADDLGDLVLNRLRDHASD